MFLIVASLCSWQGSAIAQPAIGAEAPGNWLVPALLAKDARDPGAAGDDVRWLTAGAWKATTVPAADETPPPAGPVAPSYDDYFPALGYSFTHGIAAPEQLAPLAIGTAAALVLMPFDHRVSGSLRRREVSALNRAGHVIGSPRVLGPFSGGLVLGSLATDDVRFRSYAFTLSQGLIVAGTVTTAIKLAVRRTRPDKSSRFSFPSGHASGSFALAAVTSHYYGAKAGVPLYALAALISLSRVTYGKHFPSDVVAGAAIGYISARAAILGTEHVTPAPGDASRARPGAGITVTFRF
jgi:membrane-associated phospholipid phosphatase